ncbi:MAG: class I SAM-dependent methyltransferase [Verrucomicrobia bacterium]|nr:class I SAM-dependent methyltransferase [Verrucomicrobiota bacterium]
MRLFPSAKKRRSRFVRDVAGKVVLDIGCGRRKLPGAIGVDRRVVAVASLEEQRDVDHDLLAFPYPFADNYADAIHCSHVLEHLPPTNKVMEEFYRLLKPEGLLFIECPHFSWAEAYRHYEHCHFFTAGSFDYFHPKNEHYRARFETVWTEIFFDDFTYVIGIGFIGKFFQRFYERHLAFIFPANVFCVLLRAVK